MKDSTEQELRLQVYLSRSGVASRRKCEEFIRQGRVTVNGRTGMIGSKCSLQDDIYLDNKRIKPVKQSIYVVLNKPVGYL